MTTRNNVSMAHPAGARRRRAGSSPFAFNATCAVLLLLLAAWPSEAQDDDFGYALAVIGDVNGDKVADIAASDAAHGQVAVFSGANGGLLYVVDVPDGEKADVRGRFAAVEDVNGDAVPDLAVEPSTKGPVAIFSGVDGTFLLARENLDGGADGTSVSTRGERRRDREASPAPELGRVAGDLVIADVSADGVSDIAVAGPSDGHILIYSGADGSLLRSLKLPWAKAETPLATNALRTCIDEGGYVRAGEWSTLETFWNTSATGYFYFPAGAQIKVRYGVGWFGYDGDKKTLDGRSTKTLSVGGASVVRARMQMKYARSLWVYYTIC